ncbi:hypothetical protein EJ04DRAFT_46187 [Polyplosphaeria fusca]|uniref:NACHT domain-containing protein n=1 Tax=Polyplosphaeria fusca TaxID=682080 RepID=A0A9P4QSU9_9PLEO|nr:hypothetical protein EJ04DRAFT_46187 [Polyplosphaeria fusca]
MEALAALGVASNVIQFVDFTSKVISKGVKIYRARPDPKARAVDQLQDASVTDSHNQVFLEQMTIDFDQHNRNLTTALRMHASNVDLCAADRGVLRMCDECTVHVSALIRALRSLHSSKASVWSSFITALKTVWSESQIEDLRRLLDTARQQMSLYLLAAVRHEIQESQKGYAELVTSVGQTRLAVESLFERVAARDNQWEEDVFLAMHEDYEQRKSKTSQPSLPSVAMQQHLDNEQFGDFFLELLDWIRFRELTTRYHKIAPAHSQTFQWIFSSASNRPWSNFVEWSQSATQQLYWITGKPASGKSTLMKFIYGEERTTELLARWADELNLITCAYYFWNSGTDMQMSKEGMVRTFLCNALEQEPGLWADLFPHKLEQYLASKKTWATRMSSTEVSRAFKALVDGAGKTYRLFFFIDGLDEFDGDHESLVTMIQQLLSPHVKILVSSRPWNVFEDSFNQRPNLRLEDLTYSDIKRYVTFRFQESRGFKERQAETPQEAMELVDTITRKASGVFLWVALVTDSLLEGLQEGERLGDLQSRLSNIPSDLETLFWKILTKMGDSHLARTSQMLAILQASRSPLTLLLLSYADEEDPDIVSNCPRVALSSQQADARAIILRRRLNACCKGLVESRLQPGEAQCDAKVEYLHRTVKDYIERPDVWPKFAKMAYATPFNPHVRLANAHMILLKVEDPIKVFHPSTIMELSRFWNGVKRIFQYALDADPRCDVGLQTSLLDQLDSVVSDLATLKDAWGNRYLDTMGRHDTAWTSFTHWSGTDMGECQSTSFLDLAVRFQRLDYVRHILHTSKSSLTIETRSHALLMSVLGYKVKQGHIPLQVCPSIHHDSPNAELITLLLGSGADPNMKFADCLVQINGRRGAFSTWEALMFRWQSDTPGLNEVGKSMLEHGADPRTMNGMFNSEVDRLAAKKRRGRRFGKFTSAIGLSRS